MSQHFKMDKTNCITFKIDNTEKEHSFVTVEVYPTSTHVDIFNLSKQDIYSLAEKLTNEANKIQEETPSES